MIARIFQLEANDSGLTVLLLHRFIRKRISIDYISLRIVCDSLLVGHVCLLEFNACQNCSLLVLHIIIEAKWRFSKQAFGSRTRLIKIARSIDLKFSQQGLLWISIMLLSD